MNAFPLACAETLLNIGLVIKHRRLERKIRQKDLASRTGISAATLGKIEAGIPTVEMRAYMIVLWHLGLLSEVMPNSGVPTLQSFATEHRVRLKRVSEDDF